MSKRKRAGKILNSRYMGAGKPESIKENNSFIAVGATAKLIRDHSFYRAIKECGCGYRGDIDQWAVHVANLLYLASFLEGRQKEPQKAPESMGKYRVWCKAHQEFEQVYQPTRPRNPYPLALPVEEWHGKATSEGKGSS